MMMLKWALILAFVVGIVGFALGFFGPMLFMPQSNQGPLIGIFLTGPLGVVVGALIGCVIGFIKSRPG